MDEGVVSVVQNGFLDQGSYLETNGGQSFLVDFVTLDKDVSDPDLPPIRLGQDCAGRQDNFLGGGEALHH